MRRGHAAVRSLRKYNRDADDAEALQPRRISCGRNRAGHSRDCVGYSFHLFIWPSPLLCPSPPPSCFPLSTLPLAQSRERKRERERGGEGEKEREHLLFYHLTHALVSRFLCVNAAESVAFTGTTYVIA